MKLFRTVPILAIAFVAGQSLLSAAGDAEKGKAVYDKTCKACHGATGQGNPAMVKALKIKDLGSAEVQGKPDAELKKLMQGGTAKKKPVKVTEAQTDDILAYIRTFKK